MSTSDVENQAYRGSPPSPNSLSAFRMAYTTVNVLTMICHGVKWPRNVDKFGYHYTWVVQRTELSVKGPNPKNARPTSIAPRNSPEPKKYN